MIQSILSQTPLEAEQAIKISSLSTGVLQQLQARLADLPTDGYISREELVALTEAHFSERLRMATGELSATELEVLHSVRANTLISELPEHDEPLTRGQRLADTISRFGGSWMFIGSFFVFILIWISVNLQAFFSHFDPYPFILLNLVLSCVAALQAPVIMMSQNRKEEKDRLRSINDYKVNLKAELEIRELHEKLDRVLSMLEAHREDLTQKKAGH